MIESMPVPEFNEQELALINSLKEKGFREETQALFGAWQDQELNKPEHVAARASTENASLILQAELDLKKAKILNAAGMTEDANEALEAVYTQIEAMERDGIDCTELRNEVDNLK
jgi:galactose-1-phosphate uridylyltransferase